MLNTGLEFATGTTDASKALVGRLVTPTELFGAYRAARSQFKMGDLVLRISEQDPSGFEAEPRIAYVKRLREANAGKMPFLLRGLEAQSAHGVVQLPFESDAMWLVIVRGPKEIPVTCVIYAVPYDIAEAN